jgi:multiple sugar transport system ATP-binding protein
MSELVADGITKSFGGAPVLQDVSFVARPGRVLTLLGPSGCGKSTLLRIVAGLETATRGSLRLDGRALDALPPGQRDVGFVFQNYALYPHLTVARNLSLALEARRLPKDEIERRVRESARLLEIEDLLGRKPAQLSGGQQQRVALGRALSRRPALYLMDEPLSNLDALLRESMRAELKALFRRLDATVLYVTHDQAEAMSLSDEVLVLRRGRPLQLAPPLEIYARPADLFTATFVGSPTMTIWRGQIRGGVFEASSIRILLPPDLPIPSHGRLCAGVRPEEVEVSRDAVPGGWSAERILLEPTGDRVLLTLRVGDQTLRAYAPAIPWPESVFVKLDPLRCHWFDAETEKRLETPPPPEAALSR